MVPPAKVIIASIRVTVRIAQHQQNPGQGDGSVSKALVSDASWDEFKSPEHTQKLDTAPQCLQAA